ncbi:MAG: hypothetical protein ABS54_07730 [Hyphomicrobium sp. SCN 65-11]|mgnify:CR=1 FL=1|nr:MAG: hypothetical protein ABS54_07730 [Hyphomicrobium sp. SCN 65-11]
MARKLLTDLAVESLQGRATRREIADAGMPGLYLVLQPTGAKSWALRYRYGKRPRKLTLGLYPAVTLTKARGRAQDALEALDRGDDPAVAMLAAKDEQHHTSADRDAFGNLIRQWLHDYAIPNQRSWRETARLLGLKVDDAAPLDGAEPQPDGKPSFVDVQGGIAARWAEKAVPRLRRRDIRELLDDSKARGARTTANRELAALKTFLNWCVDREVIEVSPALRIGKPAPENKRTRILTDAELRVIWLAAEAEGYPFGAIVRLLMLTGQRRGEVAGALWPELNLKRREWILPEGRTKNGLPHLGPLSDAAVEILEEMPRCQGGDFLFGLGGRTGFTGYSKGKARIDKRVTEIAKKALPEWNLHDIRRTVATSMARLGVLPHEVEAVLNHVSGSKAGVAGIYNLYSYEKEKRAALNLWAAHIARIVDVDAEDDQPETGSNVVAIKRGA